MALVKGNTHRDSQRVSQAHFNDPEPTQCGSSYANENRESSAIDMALEKLQHMIERMQRINDSHNINNRVFEETMRSFLSEVPELTDLNDALKDNRLDVKINTKGDALDVFIGRLYESMTDAEELNYKTNQLLSTLKRII